MKAQHTPGPWRVGRHGVSWAAIVADHPVKNGPIGCDDVRHYGGHMIAESVAARNAAFIAAAPAMFNELQAVEAALRECADQLGAPDNLPLYRRWIGVQVVLAEADGRIAPETDDRAKGGR